MELTENEMLIVRLLVTVADLSKFPEEEEEAWALLERIEQYLREAK